MSNVDQDRQPGLTRVATAAASTTSIVALRLACQAMVLMLSARLLGVDGFGTVAAIVAVSLVLGPWSGLGYDFIALRAISANHEESSNHFWHGVTLVVKTALPAVVIAAILAWFWASDSTIATLVVLILTAELGLLRVTELIAKIFQGNDLFREMAVTRLANSISRLLILGLVATSMSELTAVQWGCVNLLAAFSSLFFSLLYMRARLGLALPDSKWKAPRLHDGLHFAAGITSVRLSTEFDKSLVLGIAGAAGAGIYGAAQRIVSLAVAPVISLVNVVITSLFRLNSRNDTVRLRQRSLIVCAVAVAYGTVVGVGVWLVLPDVAALALGEDFRALAIGLLPLSLLVVPTSCRLVGEQAVAALGRFRMRLIVQWMVAAMSIVLNLITIPRLGWQGAAWVLVISEMTLALSFVLIIITSTSTGEERAE